MVGKYFIAVFHCEPMWPNNSKSCRERSFRPLSFFFFFFFSPNWSTTDHQVISSIWIVILLLFTLVAVAVGEDIRLCLGLGGVGVLGNTNCSSLFTVPFFFWCHVSFRVCFYFSLVCLLLLCLLVLEKYPFGDFKTLWLSYSQFKISVVQSYWLLIIMITTWFLTVA